MTAVSSYLVSNLLTKKVIPDAKIESIPNFIERSDPEGYSGEGILNKVDK